jgi:pSer/pThr/pTyr-binding forkhead associated (FHA) protein
MTTNDLASEIQPSNNNACIDPQQPQPRFERTSSPINGDPDNLPASLPEENSNMSGNGNSPSSDGFSLTRPFGMSDRSRTQPSASQNELSPSLVRVDDVSPSNAGSRGRERQRDGTIEPAAPVRCINPASDINSRLDTQVEVRVYPCNNSQGGGKKKFTTFTIKPEGVIIQGSNRSRNANTIDLGAEYAMHIGRKLQRYELSDTRACQLLVTTHSKNFWVVPAPEAFSRHSGTCRLLGDRKHPPAPHTLQVGDFLRVGSVGVVVIETHDGIENRVLSEEKIQKIMKDTTNSNGGFLDLQETDGENSEDSLEGEPRIKKTISPPTAEHIGDSPVCYMCFDEEDTETNPLITPCKCSGDTKYVHVECLRKWHTAEADNQICFLSSVDATCSVCKSTFKSDFKLRDGRHVKLFKSSLEPPYVSLLVATKHEMAQRLFNTRFQLSFSTLLKPDGRNATRPLLLGRSSGSDMVLDYRTVSARHAAIRFKNGEFIFTDAGSSNGSYLYLRRPLELSPSQSVQFRLGRSMISMKVVNKWNRRLLRAVRRTGQSGNKETDGSDVDADDRSIGSNDDDIRITDSSTGVVTKTVSRRTRESVLQTMPAPGQLSQQSSRHLDLLYALAYPKRDLKEGSQSRSSSKPRVKVLDEVEEGEGKVEDEVVESNSEGVLATA